MTDYRVARANAGTVNHALPYGTLVALCGFQPKPRPGSKIPSGWFTSPGITSVTCTACLEKQREGT